MKELLLSSGRISLEQMEEHKFVRPILLSVGSMEQVKYPVAALLLDQFEINLMHIYLE